MNSLFQTYYQSAYRNTGGYIATQPAVTNIYPGDFFQIKNGQFLFLGNIFNPKITDQFEVDFEYDIRLNEQNWSFQSGASKPYAGRGMGQGPIDGQFEYSRQVIRLAQKGDFLFKGSRPLAARIANWADIANELIVKLTQVYYSFREVYVVTETVALDSWTLAIAGSEEAELEMATENENFGLIDLFGEQHTKTIQSKGVDYYQQAVKRNSSFFKAKKLVVKNDKTEQFIADLIQRKSKYHNWAESFYPYKLDQVNGDFSNMMPAMAAESVLDMLRGNDLNPTTALDYFSWQNADLTDVLRLFELNG